MLASWAGIMIGSFEQMLGGVLTKGAITPFPVRALSLSVGVIFEESAAENKALLTEFRAVQKS